MRLLVIALVVAVAVMAAGGAAQAQTTTTIDVFPWEVPDEQEPRGNLGDAPPGFGNDSWQGPATGKSNWHARYLADGDRLSDLFGAQTAGLTIGDLAEISYWTKRPDGTPAGRDWWIQIYTRHDDTVGAPNQASWYQYRFTSNYNEHTNTGDWVQYSTSDLFAPMTFSGQAGYTNTNEMSLADFKSAYGNLLIEMISVQTDSGWNGFDGYMDGLEIRLTNGDVGRVNFEVIPEPIFYQMGALMGMSGLGLLRLRKRS